MIIGKLTISKGAHYLVEIYYKWAGFREQTLNPFPLNKMASTVARVCVFITAGPIIKLCAGGEGDSEGHVL